MKLALAIATAAMLVAAPAYAAQPVNAAGGKGLVNVSLAGLLNNNNVLDDNTVEILTNANIEVLNGNTVQVPINVAATICNVDVNVIASSNDKGTKSCDATTEGLAAIGQ